MANETLGASFSIDVTDLKTGLAQANKLIRESESEFKAAAAGMDDWGKSQEGLESRLKHLNTAADLQRQKVEALQNEYDRLIDEGLDPTSAQAVELRTKINKETETLNKNETEIRKQTKALEELENATDEAGDAAEESADGFTVAGGAIATFIGNGLTALTDAAKNAIGTIMGLAESTREYRTIMASLENSSKLAGYSVAETEETFKHLNGVLGDTQGAATTTANLQAIGLEQSKLQELTDGVIGAWAKYGDSIPIDGLAEAVNHTVQLGEVQGNLADVIEWAGGDVEKFNEKLAKCSTETERADLIQKMLAEQGLTEAGKAWQENNESIVEANNAQADYEKTMAELGETIEPITNKFTELKTKGLQWFVDKGLPALEDGWGWLKDNLPTVATIVGGLTAAITAQATATKVKTLLDAAHEKGITLTKMAQDGLNKSMKANAIGLIVTGITLLVSAFIYLWNNCEGFRNFFIKMWEGIKNATAAVVDWFKKAFTDVSNFFSNFGENTKKIFTDLWDGIKKVWAIVSTWFSDNVIKPVKDFFVGMWDGLKNGAKNAWEGIKNTFSTVASFFGDIFSKAWQKVKDVFSVGGKIFDGIKDGIVSVFKTVVNAIIKGINKVVKVPFDGLNGILDKIQKVSVAGIKPFSWLKWRANAPQLPLLATGGVVDKATTAVIGEDGAEAVMPLEKNTGWIKKLAKEIAAEQGQGMIINQTNNFQQAYTSRKEKYKAKQELYAAARLVKAGAI